MNLLVKLIKYIATAAILCALALPVAYTLFEIKHRSTLNKTTESLVNDIRFAQQSAINLNKTIEISAINEDWNNGWVIESPNGINLKTFKFGKISNLTINSLSNINTIQFKANGITKLLAPLGNNGIKICNSLGQGSQLKMIASGFVKINNIQSNCNA